MKREEDWVKMVAIEVVNIIEKKVLVENDELKSELIKNVTKAFKQFDEALLEEKEDEIISEKYAHRANLPDDQWLEVPEGMTIGEFYYSSRRSGDSK